METSVNNKCRAFTSLEQSKKLAEILPIESADMEWVIDGLGEPFPFPIENKVGTDEQPCWSLTALLNTLPQTVRLVGTSKDSYWYCECVNGNNQSYAGFGSADNPIDACVEMILKLDKLKML